MRDVQMIALLPALMQEFDWADGGREHPRKK